MVILRVKWICCGIKSESQNIIINCNTQWVLCNFIHYKVLFVLCLYVYCNLLEIIRGGSRKLGGKLSPLKALKKHCTHTHYMHVHTHAHTHKHTHITCMYAHTHAHILRIVHIHTFFELYSTHVQINLYMSTIHVHNYMLYIKVICY